MAIRCVGTEIIKGKAVPLRAKRAQRGATGIALHMLNLGDGRGWVVTATPRPLCPRERYQVPFT
jgi:hypothetical protein